jgi:glycosyltransferase involved in cell wall biosynthesis
LILGFHYHNTVTVKDNKLYVPGYIGVFIDGLAHSCEKLYFFCEEQTNKNNQSDEYALLSTNIEWVNLGTKSTFYNRVLFPGSKVNIIGEYTHYLDALLVRAPTPLAPFIWKELESQIPIYPLMVGDYKEGLKDLEQPIHRKIAITILTHYYQWKQNQMIAKSRIFVNSLKLKEKYEHIAKEITPIKTTTLNKESFFKRQDTCTTEIIKLLYTGRINFQKGLRELVQAVAELKTTFNLELHIVGWEDPGEFSYTNAIKELAVSLGIDNYIFFHGKKNIGEELNAYYRNSDIYLIPSYHEGFPRTIWESMANSLPVIATSVGSIPYYLKNNHHALLITPKSVQTIKDAIIEILNNEKLRQELISNGFSLAQEITLEKQTAILMDGIKNYISKDSINH